MSGTFPKTLTRFAGATTVFVCATLLAMLPVSVQTQEPINSVADENVRHKYVAQQSSDHSATIAGILKELQTTPAADRSKLIPALFDALVKSKEHVVQQTAYVFKNELAGNVDVVKFLVRQLQGNPEQKLAAATLLLAMSYQRTFSVPSEDMQVLTSALEKERDPKVREAVAQILPRTGALQLSEIKTTLIKALSADSAPEVRLQCAMSLGEVGREEYFGNSPSTIKALSEALSQDRNDRVRAHAAYALGSIGEKAGASAPVLCSALKDNSSDVRGSAMQAVGKIGPPGAAAVPILIEVLNGPNENLPRGSAKFLAANALGELGKAAAPAVPALTKLLAEPHIGLTAANSLSRIGSAAAPAVPELIALLDSPDYQMRTAAAKCLGSIGPAAKSAVAALKKAAQDTRNQSGHGNTGFAQKTAQEALLLIERQ